MARCLTGHAFGARLMRRIGPPAVRVATRGTSRAINRQIVLDLVRTHEPLSRADLARAMNVARGAVTMLVNELIADGLLVEGVTDASSTQRGRKPTFLHVNASRRVVVAVDLRVSESFVVLTDLVGQALAPVTGFVPQREPRALARQLGRIVRGLLDTHARGLECAGIGVVVPGMVDRATSRVIKAPTFGWVDRDIATPIANATHLPVHIENSGRACALAQLWTVRRELPTRGDFVFVSVSDGLGVGVVVNGEILRGRHNIAGEFGHVPLSIDGPICSCGATGCWEAYVSNRATVSRYLLQPVDHVTVGATTSPASIDDVMRGVREGDARALAAVSTTARYLGLGLASIVNALDPDRVYVGGEITEAWDVIADIVRAALAERVLTASAKRVDVRVVPSRDAPRLFGAAALVAGPQFSTETVVA